MDVEGLCLPEEVRRGRFARLTMESREVLQTVAKRYCKHDRAEVEDLIQDTYERAWRNLESLQDESKAVSWLIRIMHNLWIDRCRKRTKLSFVNDVPDEPFSAVEPSPWERVTVHDFHRALDQLAEPYRSIAIMHDVDQLSNAQIAEKLNIPYATAATRLHRAHKQLKPLLCAALDRAEEEK